MQKPDWALWAKLPHVQLQEAVALSCNIDPSRLSDGPQDEYNWRFNIAESWLRAGRLPTVDRHVPNVELAEFRAWGESLQAPFAFPDEFPRHREAARAEPAQAEQDKPLDTRERTTLLRAIRALIMMAKLPERGGAPSIEKQLQTLGFDSPKDATIRRILDEARALEPDGKPQ